VKLFKQDNNFLLLIANYFIKLNKLITVIVLLFPVNLNFHWGTKCDLNFRT